MNNREMIKILFLENNKSDIGRFSKIQDVEKNPDDSYTKIKIFPEHFSSDQTKEDQRKQMDKFIDTYFEEADILLLDLILREDDEELAIEEHTLRLRYPLLSIEIANHYNPKFNDKGKLIGFTSRHREVYTRHLFKKFQSMNNKKVNADWFFIMKPRFKGDDPRFMRPCPELCKFQSYHRGITCDSLECIHHQIVSLFIK